MCKATLDFMSFNKKDMPIRDYAYEFVKTRPLLTEQQKELAPRMARLVELYHGIKWQDISSRYGGLENSGRDAYVKGGYDTIYQRVFEEIDGSKSTVKLNTEVVKITSGKKIKIETNEGTYSCDYFINTIPLGVLRKHSLFANPLPESLQKAIDISVWAALGKVYFEFEDVFWRTDIDRMVVLGDDVESNGDPRPFDNPIFFTNGALIFGRPCLVSLIAPPLTQFIENNPDKVESFYKPILEVLRVDKSKPLPKIKSFKTTNWTNDKYAYGSYSSLPVGQTFDEAVLPFIEGADNIRFAGEHATLEGNGCTHGAFSAGDREAKYVVNKFCGGDTSKL